MIEHVVTENIACCGKL